MTKRFKDGTTRAQWWNYAESAAYFVTIVTKDRTHFFGEIENGKMNLSELGTIAETEWLKTFELRKDMRLEMGEFVVMPDHFHAIVIIGFNSYNLKTDLVPGNQFGPQSKNLASIMRGFKSAVTTWAKKNNMPDFGWQSRFYDHIIRDQRAFENITNYIKENPANWQKKKLNGVLEE